MGLVQENILLLDSKFQNNEIKIDASVTDEVGNIASLVQIVLVIRVVINVSECSKSRSCLFNNDHLINKVWRQTD